MEDRRISNVEQLNICSNSPQKPLAQVNLSLPWRFPTLLSHLIRVTGSSQDH